MQPKRTKSGFRVPGGEGDVGLEGKVCGFGLRVYGLGSRLWGHGLVGQKSGIGLRFELQLPNFVLEGHV